MPALQFIHQHPDLFAHTGVVVASYRTRGTTRYGPYFRVAYRQDRRQRSLYLGRSNRLAEQARQLLAQLQQPRDYRRQCRKAERDRRATLRRVIRQWQQTIRAYGLDLRGCEVRGWRALGIPRLDKTTPLTAAQKSAAAIFRSPPPFQTTPDQYEWSTDTGSPDSQDIGRSNRSSDRCIRSERRTPPEKCRLQAPPTPDPRYWQNPILVDQQQMARGRTTRARLPSIEGVAVSAIHNRTDRQNRNTTIPRPDT